MFGNLLFGVVQERIFSVRISPLIDFMMEITERKFMLVFILAGHRFELRKELSDVLDVSFGCCGINFGFIMGTLMITQFYRAFIHLE